MHIVLADFEVSVKKFVDLVFVLLGGYNNIWIRFVRYS